MSMMPQPPAPEQPFPPPLRVRFFKEWLHFSTLPQQRFLLLLVPSLMLFCIDPLLPIVAYLLQMWAGSSWAWRDRWTSTRIQAKLGAWWFVGLLIYAALDRAQVWFFPTLITSIQVIWQRHFSSDLSLSPFDGHDLLVRSLLLLLLAPALSILYEWIDPRTRTQSPRVFTASDREALKREKMAASSSTPPTEETAAQAPTQEPPAPAKKKRTSRTQKQPIHSAPAEQMTIDSFLTRGSDCANCSKASENGSTKTTCPITPFQR